MFVQNRVVATRWLLETGQTISRRFVCAEKFPDAVTRVGPSREFPTKFSKDSTTRRSQMCPAGSLYFVCVCQIKFWYWGRVNGPLDTFYHRFLFNYFKKII